MAAYDRLGVVRSREGNRLANSAPLDNYPTADGKFVCIVAGSDAELLASLPGDGPARPPRRSALHEARGSGPDGDVINGIVADWTTTLDVP